jgi:hypothetical protein
VRKPFHGTYLVEDEGLQAAAGSFNRLNHVAVQNRLRAPESVAGSAQRHSLAFVDINHVPEGVTGVSPLAINKA